MNATASPPTASDPPADETTAQPSPRYSTSRRLLLALIPCAVVIVLILAAADLLQAKQQLQAGGDDVSAFVALSHGGNGLQNPSTRREMRSKLDAAAEAFENAHNDLWLWGGVLSDLGWVPSIGGSLRAALPLSETGYQSAEAARDIFRGLSRTWPAVAARGHHLLLDRLAPALAHGKPAFAAAMNRSTQAIRSMRAIPTNVGNASINHKVAQLHSVLPNLRDAAHWLSVAPVLLGDRSPSRILFVWENPNELRPTGGFIPAENYLTVDNGRIKTDPMGSWFNNYVEFPVPAPEAFYTAEDSWLFEDSNWSPDFPLSARYERWMFGLNTGLWEPMVVDVLGGASDILTATGPLYLTRYHLWVNAANVAHWIEYYHHHNSATTDTQSQQFLAVLFDTILQHVESLSPKGLLAFGGGLHDAIHDQTLLMYDRRPAVESAIRSAGASGAIAEPKHDSLFVVDDNLSYNKLNPYIHENANYSVRVSRHLQATATLTLHYYDAPSPRNLLGAGPYFGTGYTKHDYQDFIRVYVPPGATLLTETGADRWAPIKAYGLTEFGGRMLLREGRRNTITLRYRLPQSIFHASDGKKYLLTIQRQPGSNLHRVNVSVHVGQGMSVGSSHDLSVSNTIPIDTARTTVSLLLSGAKNLSIPILKAPQWRADPFIPAASFHGNKTRF